MNVVKFSLILGVGLLAFLFVLSLYVVWTRMVGLYPTVAQRCAQFSRTVQGLLAVVFGVSLGTASQGAPSVEYGIAGIVMLAASTFAALMLFELVQQRQLTVQ